MARTLALALALSLSVLMACGGDDDAGTASTDSDTMSPDTMPTGTTQTTSSTGQCSTWVMTYDLTGSKFFIDALIDFTITLQDPYDADGSWAGKVADTDLAKLVCSASHSSIASMKLDG